MNLHPKKLDLGGMFFFDEHFVAKSWEEKMQRPGKGLGDHGGGFWTDGFPSFLDSGISQIARRLGFDVM